MLPSAGFSPSMASSGAATQERPLPAVQALQAEAVKGRTRGTGEAPMTASGITGPLGSERSSRTGKRNLPQDVGPRPDADTPTGPPPAFDFTPLEKLKYPPSPLEALTRRVRSGALQEDDPQSATGLPERSGATRADGTDGTEPAAKPAPAPETAYAQGETASTAGAVAHDVDVWR